MTTVVNTLLEALPRDVDEASAASQEGLGALLADLSHRPVPVSRVTRFWILGTLHAKLAAGYLAWWMRSGFSAPDQRDRLLNETHLSAAIKVLGAMGYLRGAITKVGQMLAAYPKLLPEEFFTALSSLHFEAPSMHYSLIREFLRDELGADPRELFAEFETDAFAAASLGQVHRARLRSGEVVAVKVQYPGIANTIEADFRNFLSLLAPMRLSRDWELIRIQLDDARATLLAETNYLREAQLMEKARREFGENEGIVVPRSYPQWSTGRVLTMDFLDGVHLEEFLRGNPSQAQRNRYGELIMRASFRIAHKGRFWYADSNPGNYLFLRDGRLGLIDFGCCREFTEDEWNYYEGVWRYQQTGAGRREAMMRCGGLRPGEPVDEQFIEFMDKCFHWWCDYMARDEDFDFGDPKFMQRGLELAREMAGRRYFRTLPVNMWITRQLLGLRTLAHRLGASINMYRLGREEAWGMPMS